MAGNNLIWQFTRILMALILTCSHALSHEKDDFLPIDLTVNFLLHPDLVLMDGYPVQLDLYEAIHRDEKLQFVEMKHKQPLFGWVIQSSKKNTVQTAYRIIVASTYANADAGNGDFWDSGKVESQVSTNVKYEGKTLKPDSVYFWRIMICDNHGRESDFSHIQQFKCGTSLLDYPGATTYPLMKQDYFPDLILPVGDKQTLLDFGKARFGRLRLNVYGDSVNQRINIHMGEKLKMGRIDRDPEGSIRYESFSLKLNQGWHTYEVLIPPHYGGRPDRIIRMPEYIGNVMPFRYCEIENYSCDLLKKEKIQQIAVSYPFEENSTSFFCSDSVLNSIWEMCKHTIKSTSFCGIYVDGDRERFPREADSYINQLSHYGVERGFSLARHTHEFQITYSSQWTEWLMHVVLMAWADFIETGDPASMEHYYEDLKAKTLLALARDDGLISTRTGEVTWDVIESVHWQKTEWQRQKKKMPNFRDIVDWPQSGRLGLPENQGETDGFLFTDFNTVVNAFHYRALLLMGKMAGNLGIPEDAASYKKQAELVKESFNAVFFNHEKGVYVDGVGTNHSSLHANMFALAHGLVPKNKEHSVVEFIKSRGLACSPYGSLYLLEALYKAGEADYALDLITNRTSRGWARWIYEFGSTNTLESWGPEYKPNLDWSHPWGSAPGSVIPRKVMGIEPLEPGYDRISIKPQPGWLKHAKIKLTTIKGEITVALANSEDQFELLVDLPVNVLADIYLPGNSSNAEVKMDGNDILAEETGEFLLIKDVGSGKHSFTLRY